jgi:asparagine synthase (glutamine-hydrolysing)
VAEHLGTSHQERIATPDLATILPKIVWHGEDPVADSSMIPVYYLSRMTRENVTVALTGDGADEILAGYPTHRATPWAHRLEFLPDGLLSAIVGPVLSLLPVSERKISRRERLYRFANGVGLPWRHAHAVWREIHTEKEKRAIVREGAVTGREALFRAYDAYYDRVASRGMLDQMLYVDTCFYLPNDMLAKVDRMSMAHSLETRVPYLDHELVEYAATLPDHLKLRGGVGKAVLRDVMAGRLPEVTLTRSKVGFNIPVGKWLRGELYEMLADNLSTDRLNRVGIWRPEGVERMVRAHRRRERDYGHQLWGLLTFMLWWQQFVEHR